MTLLRILRYVPRSCLGRLAIIEYVSELPYVLSAIFDTLSILIDTVTFCGSVSPGKEQLVLADKRRLYGWLLLF